MRNAAIVALFLSGAALFTIGCNKDEGSGAAPAPTAAADPDSTGVAECDDYFKQMKACYESNPAAKDSMEATMKQMREVFRATA